MTRKYIHPGLDDGLSHTEQALLSGPAGVTRREQVGLKWWRRFLITSSNFRHPNKEEA